MLSLEKPSIMARRAVIIFSVCICLTTVVTGQFSKATGRDNDAAIVDVKTAQQKWALSESRMKSLVHEAIKTLLPRLREQTRTLNISSTCVKNGLEIIGGLKSLKSWAVKFVDASSKSIDGIMGATLSSFGAFDECVDTKVMYEKSGNHKADVLFQGMYCRVEVRPYLPPKPPTIYFTDRLDALQNFTNEDTATGEMASFAHLLYSTSLIAGLCVPSGCSKHDINQVLREAGDYLGIVISAKRCEIKEETEFTPLMIGVLVLYSFAGFLVLISSLVDIYCHYKETKPQGRNIELLCSFSILTNFRKFTDTSTSSATFSCLNGIRSLTICWIILSHTYFLSSFQVQSVPRDVEKYLQEFFFQIIINGTLAVDTFLFIGGMLLCYGTTRLIKIGKKPFSVTMYVIHRLWRILPAYIFAIAIMFLAPLGGSGPLFHETLDHFVQTCKKNWWTSILFINNFYDTENMCLPHGWYLTVDMQFYLGALVILLPLMRWPKVGISIAVSITLASMVGSALHTYISDMPPAPIISPSITDVERYFRDVFVKPHCHAAAYCIGIMCGYLLAMQPKIKIPRVVQVVGWCLTVIFSLCVVNGVQRWYTGVTPTFWEKMFYSSCHRVAWTLGVAWVIVACSTGHGGIGNHILSWKMWIPMGRLSFLAYLLHPSIMLLYQANTRAVFYFSHLTAVWLFFGHLVATYIAAFGGTMLVEAPFLSLEKVIFAKKRDKLLSGTSQNNKCSADDDPFQVTNGVINVLNMKNHVSEGKNGVANATFVCRL